jgi:hypothetical protein
MEITKSSRHKKIIGNFGENLICNWLSRSRFEVIIVDHTGVDIIAYNPSTNERLGITVKSRTRSTRKGERDSVNVFLNKKDDRHKLAAACQAFECKPWIAIYVETQDFADVYLTSLENYDMKYRGSGERAVDNWKMGEKDKQHYAEDSKVKHIRIKFLADSWSW